MATIYWQGKQKTVAQLYNVTVSSVSAGQTITATIGGKVETYTAVGTDTTVAAAGAAAYFTSVQSLTPEFQNYTFTSNGAVITATGQPDGRPVAITWGGTATLSGTTVAAAARSPSDIADGVNYSGGSVPTGGDTLILEDGSVPMLWNLDTFASIAVNIIKRASYTGSIGLPTTNRFGYPEFLPTMLQVQGTSHQIYDNGSVARIHFTSTSAVTAVGTGPGGQRLGEEAVEVTGTSNSSSVLRVSGAGVAVSPLNSQAATFGTVTVADGSFRSGPAAVLTNVSIFNSQFSIGGNYTTLLADRNAEGEVTMAATAATSTTVESGRLSWRSTGGWGALKIGSDATVDASQTPDPITSGTITMDEGATLNDPYKMITRPYNVVFTGQPNRTTFDLGTGVTVTVN